MPHSLDRTGFPLAALAVTCAIALSPSEALAGQNGQRPAQPPAGKGTVVVEQVQNGPAFGVEFKYTEMNRRDAFLLGGYGGFVFDGKLLIGGAGYWQVNTSQYNYYGDEYYYDPGYAGCYYGCGHSYLPYDVNGYGGLLLEWFALRSPAIAVSARGLIGGGVASVGWNGYTEVPAPDPHHEYDGGYYGGYAYNQGYFVFEPQANVTVRIARGVAMVGGVGYRVIGWANGWEDQIQGLTGTFAIRFGGGK